MKLQLLKSHFRKKRGDGDKLFFKACTFYSLVVFTCPLKEKEALPGGQLSNISNMMKSEGHSNDSQALQILKSLLQAEEIMVNRHVYYYYFF